MRISDWSSDVCSSDVQAAISEAATRIEAFHAAGIALPYALETAPGVMCERIHRPIRRVGLYVPAGTAPLPSTALMLAIPARSEEHTSELQSLMRISYAVFCLKKKTQRNTPKN